MDNKWKIFTYLMGTIVLFICAVIINDWSAKHKFQNPISVSVKTQPIAVRKKFKVIKPVPDTPELPEWYMELSDLEKKIVDTFGIENGQVALAVAQAESGLSCEAVNANGNGSVDLSVFQVNSLWLEHYSLEEISDCDRNIEIAYEIWDRADGQESDGKGSFRPWSAFSSTSFVKFLD